MTDLSSIRKLNSAGLELHNYLRLQRLNLVWWDFRFFCYWVQIHLNLYQPTNQPHHTGERVQPMVW